jgi:hypothetical protein
LARFFAATTPRKGSARLAGQQDTIHPGQRALFEDGAERGNIVPPPAARRKIVPPMPIYWLWAMAESGIPEKLLPAIRVAVFWIALPFILLLVGIERIFDSHGQAGACFVGAIASIVIAVYWDKLIPSRFQEKKRLEYLRDKDSALGSAVRDMTWYSAWAKWYSAQHLVNSGAPIPEDHLLSSASSIVTDQLTDGQLEVRGRLPGKMDYELIPRTHWRSSHLHFVPDSRTLWRMKIIPRGGAQITSGGAVIADDPVSQGRTAILQGYDSLIVDAYEFEKLWPKREPVADKKRRQFLRQALRRGLDKSEILRLLGGTAKWQLQLLRFGLAGIVGF